MAEPVTATPQPAPAGDRGPGTGHARGSGHSCGFSHARGFGYACGSGRRRRLQSWLRQPGNGRSRAGSARPADGGSRASVTATLRRRRTDLVRPASDRSRAAGSGSQPAATRSRPPRPRRQRRPSRSWLRPDRECRSAPAARPRCHSGPRTTRSRGPVPVTGASRDDRAVCGHGRVPAPAEPSAAEDSIVPAAPGREEEREGAPLLGPVLGRDHARQCPPPRLARAPAQCRPRASARVQRSARHPRLARSAKCSPPRRAPAPARPGDGRRTTVLVAVIRGSGARTGGAGTVRGAGRGGGTVPGETAVIAGELLGLDTPGTTVSARDGQFHDREGILVCWQ